MPRARSDERVARASTLRGRVFRFSMETGLIFLIRGGFSREFDNDQKQCYMAEHFSHVNTPIIYMGDCEKVVYFMFSRSFES